MTTCAACRRPSDVVRLKIFAATKNATVRLKVLKTCSRCLRNTNKYYADNKNRAREYHAANKDRLNKRSREYYAAKKTEIATRKNPYNTAKWDGDSKFRIRSILNGAKQRGYEYALTDEQAEALLRGACEYCGHKDDDVFNGIDRVDNSQGYLAANCAAACKTCNFMKCTASVEEFSQRCAHISGLAVCPDAFPDCPEGGNFAKYVRGAAKRNLAFELSKNEFLELTQRDCEYCGKPSTATHTNGVDRVDNSQGYVAANCVAACKTCNFLKRAMAVDDFQRACERVAVYM